MKNLLFSFLMIVLATLSANAQTIHAIIFTNTTDESIGSAMKIDRMNVRKEIQNIAEYIDYDIELYDYFGSNCTKDNLISMLDELSVGKEDIIFFFYGGHGSHAFNNQEDPFPQMCMNTSVESLWVPLKTVKNKLSKKGAKFVLITSNCCNMEQSGVSIKPLLAQYQGYTRASEVDKSAYVRMFTESKTKLAIITSSKLGEYSWCNPVDGGLFTCDFWDEMYNVGSGKASTNWETFLKGVQTKTGSREIRTREAPYFAKQHPYFEIDSSAPKGDGVDRPKPVKESLFKAVNGLLGSISSREQRLAKVSGVLQKYFATGAKVKTVGRNLTFVIDYEDAETFLNRICLADDIEQIDIVDGTDGRNNIIVVHEIHK